MMALSLILRPTSSVVLLALATLTGSASTAQLPPVCEPVPVVVRPAPTPTRLLGAFDETNGEPMAGVEVMDMTTGTSALTTATGTVSLSFLSPGGAQVRIRKVGFAVQTMDIALGPADTTPITVVMKRVTELPAVVTKDAATRHISPALRAFEERRKNRTSGYFINDSILRREDNRTLANVLRAHAPGVGISQRSSATFLTKSPRCSNGGQPDVYMDGVPLAHLPDQRWPSRVRNPSDTRDFPIDIGQFQIADLAGVEYYPDNATMPVQFSRTSAGCGALFLWTRER